MSQNPVFSRQNRVTSAQRRESFAVSEVCTSTFSSGVATMIRKTDMSDSTLESILLANRIPLAEWEEWKNLVFFGTRPSKELLAHLHRGNRKGALGVILAQLSEAYYRARGIKFPPKDSQPSCRKAS
jgi:hypothetical protein